MAQLFTLVFAERPSSFLGLTEEQVKLLLVREGCNSMDDASESLCKDLDAVILALWSLRSARVFSPFIFVSVIALTDGSLR